MEREGCLEVLKVALMSHGPWNLPRSFSEEDGGRDQWWSTLLGSQGVVA